MVLAIDSSNLFDIDAKDEKYEELLFLQPVTSDKFLLMREPTMGQLSAVSLALSGRKANPNAAIRDFMESLILTKEEVAERAKDDDEDAEQLALLVEREQIVDFDFLLERLADPTYTFDEDALVKLVRHVLERRSGFPTKPSSASSASPRTAGSSSRAASRRVRSTPSD